MGGIIVMKEKKEKKPLYSELSVSLTHTCLFSAFLKNSVGVNAIG